MATGIKQQSKNPIKSQEFLADPGSSLSLSLSLSSLLFSFLLLFRSRVLARVGRAQFISTQLLKVVALRALRL